MKVRVTFDVTDTDRLILGAVQEDGTFQPAPREAIVSFIEDLYTARMAEAREVYEAKAESIRASIREALALDTIGVSLEE